MITVKRLKELIADLPDDARCYAYEGEDTGIVIRKGTKYWWISASECQFDEDSNEGFDITAG